MDAGWRFNFRRRLVKPKETKPPPMTSRERQKAYMKRLREQPEKYKAFLEKDRQRQSDLRKKEKSEEKLENDRKNSRLRSKKYRDRLKARTGKTSLKCNGTIKTRQEREKLRAYWRKKKQQSRERLSSQKKRRVKEYDRNRKLASGDIVLNTKQMDTGDFDTQQVKNDLSSPYTPASKRKAISRARKALPRDSKKFAEAVSGVVETSTPTKRKYLIEKGIIPVKKRNLEESIAKTMKNEINELKKTRTRKAIIERRKYIQLVRKYYRSLRQMSADLGIRYAYLAKCSKVKEEEVWSNRSDGLDKKTEALVKDFYVRPDISISLPDMSKVKDGLVTRVMQHTVQDVFNRFKGDNPDVKLSKSKFAALKPKCVKPQSKTVLRQCLCEYCANVELKLKELRKHLKDQEDTFHDKYTVTTATMCKKDENDKFNWQDCIYRSCDECGVKKLANSLGPVKKEKKSSMAQMGHCSTKQWFLEKNVSGCTGKWITICG